LFQFRAWHLRALNRSGQVEAQWPRSRARSLRKATKCRSKFVLNSLQVVAVNDGTVFSTGLRRIQRGDPRAGNPARPGILNVWRSDQFLLFSSSFLHPAGPTSGSAFAPYPPRHSCTARMAPTRPSRSHHHQALAARSPALAADRSSSRTLHIPRARGPATAVPSIVVPFRHRDDSYLPRGPRCVLNRLSHRYPRKCGLCSALLLSPL
jgi:hypothetical protein